MKKKIRIYPVITLFFWFGLSASSLWGGSSAGSLNTEFRNQDTLSYYTITGIIRDASNNTGLEYATLSVEGSGISTLSNKDGKYSLKIPVFMPDARVSVSYMGYKKTVVKVSPSDRMLNIKLEASPVQLSEVTVRANNASSIVAEALRRIPQNYSRDPNMMVGFYRESIKKNNQYISLIESILDIYKSGYSMSISDQARLYKGRKGSDKEKIDTIMFKFQGGVNSALDLDMVRHPDILLTLEPMKSYIFVLGNPVTLNERPQYTVAFTQNPDVKEILFRGKLFIDMETYAITRAEFNMNVENNPAAQYVFIKRKPNGFSLKPISASYIMDFREQDGKWYYNYSRTEVQFSTKWDKRLFRSNFSIQSEMAVTDRYTEGLQRFPISERIRNADVIAEKVSDFQEENFWGEYNVIEPDQTVEQAIKRLSRVLKRRN